jgi:hypothetical protein
MSLRFSGDLADLRELIKIRNLSKDFADKLNLMSVKNS